MKKYFLVFSSVFLLHSQFAQALPCSFDAAKDCMLFRDVLNDVASGLHYYAPTNYDHRPLGGELSVFDSTLVAPYSDNVNKPGQLALTAKRVNGGLFVFKGGEIMTRVNLTQAPFNSPVKSLPFTTKELTHGFVEVVLKMPKCDVSDDGLCQSNAAPESYSRGLWPYIWFLPTTDSPWPQNGEMDVMEGYKKLYNFKQTLTSLHFEGTSGDCDNSNCKDKINGFLLPPAVTATPIYSDFHKWGFEWEPDPLSTKQGALISGYFDNVKIWGPLRTDYLPSDGPKALARGFNDPLGGFYLTIALAVGGPYVGDPNSHLQSASMKIQSIKAYSVKGASVTPPPQVKTCFPPYNIVYHLSKDKKQVSFTFDPEADEGDPAIEHEVYNYQRQYVWEGEADESAFTDTSIANVPGPGRYPFYFYTICASGTSYKAYRKTVTVP